jgi:hypothetical protein
MNKAKPVGIWIRVSTEDQAKGESPEHHEKRARFYAESKGWEVKEVYLFTFILWPIYQRRHFLCQKR